MRVLVTGCRGQLGNELKRLFETGRAEIGNIPACFENAAVHYTDVDALDITDHAAVASLFEAERFDLVINCAAMTNVDGCEAHESAARAVNATAPGVLGEACVATGAKLVHVSTDYVFSGTVRGERVESDEVGPLSAYGRTKLEGERLALLANPRTFVVRTAWLYGRVGKNFVGTTLRLLREHGGMTVVNDQVGNPTSANDLAYEILRIAETDAYGIYHCTNNGICSWFEFAQAIAELAGFDKESVRPCTSEEYAAAHSDAAPRPRFSALRNRHLEETIGDEMRPWRDALISHLSNMGMLRDREDS